MATAADEILLTSREMARFVSSGYLRMDTLVPADINLAAAELFAGGLEPVASGRSVADTYSPGTVLRRLVDLPAIRGAIWSLVGPAPIVDHHYLHVRYAGEPSVQRLHSDGILDLRRTGFDVQLMYYPAAVSAEMGPTLVIPGSQFRQINELDIARYQNLRGQLTLDGPAGSVVFAHHGLWHCGRSNSTSAARYMFQLRLNPTIAPCRTWNLSDLANPEIDDILRQRFAWYEYADARFELVNRIRLWRALTGDQDYDIDMLFTRLQAAGDTEDAPGLQPFSRPRSRAANV